MEGKREDTRCLSMSQETERMLFYTVNECRAQKKRRKCLWVLWWIFIFFIIWFRGVFLFRFYIQHFFYISRKLKKKKTKKTKKKEKETCNIWQGFPGLVPKDVKASRPMIWQVEQLQPHGEDVSSSFLSCVFSVIVDNGGGREKEKKKKQKKKTKNR